MSPAKKILFPLMRFLQGTRSSHADLARTTSLVLRPGLLRHVLDEAGRAVHSDGHEGPDYRRPASLGGRCRRGQVRVHHGHHRTLPEGRKLPYPGPGYAPCHLDPGPGELRGEPRAPPDESAPPSSTTGRPPPESDVSVPRPRRPPKSPLRFAGEAVSTRSEVLLLGQRFTRAARTLSSRSVERMPGTSCGASGSTTSAGRSSLRADEPGLELGVDPERLRRSSRHEQHESRAAEPGGALHYAGGQKSLLRRVVGVEDREGHPLAAPEGGEVRGGYGRKALHEVRFGLRTGDDDQDTGKPLSQVIYGMQRGENVRYPRLIEDRHSTFLSSRGRCLTCSISSPQEVLV